MRVLRDQYLQEWERGRGDEGERKRERKCVQTAYLAKAVESHRLQPHFPLEPPDKQCGIETYQQQYQRRELSTSITQQICQQQQ